MDIGTVSFDDLFDFSPEPPQELSDNSYELEREKMRLSGGDWEVRESQQQLVRTITNTHQLGLNKTGATKVKTEPEVAVNQLWEELPETEPSEVGDSGRSYEVGRRGRRSGSKPDIRVKLERSRQSARECRARKKLRYQYLDDMILGQNWGLLVLSPH